MNITTYNQTFGPFYYNTYIYIYIYIYIQHQNDQLHLF